MEQWTTSEILALLYKKWLEQIGIPEQRGQAHISISEVVGELIDRESGLKKDI